MKGVYTMPRLRHCYAIMSLLKTALRVEILFDVDAKVPETAIYRITFHLVTRGQKFGGFEPQVVLERRNGRLQLLWDTFGWQDADFAQRYTEAINFAAQIMDDPNSFAKRFIAVPPLSAENVVQWDYDWDADRAMRLLGATLAERMAMLD